MKISSDCKKSTKLRDFIDIIAIPDLLRMSPDLPEIACNKKVRGENEAVRILTKVLKCIPNKASVRNQALFFPIWKADDGKTSNFKCYKQQQYISNVKRFFKMQPI